MSSLSKPNQTDLPPRLYFAVPLPPPFHGQSIMTARLLELLRANHYANYPERLIVLNTAISRTVGEIGGFGLLKVWKTLTLFLRLLALRVRYGPGTLYYIPATGVRTQVWRDFLLVGAGRCCFSRVVLHWHGLGLGDYLKQRTTRLERFCAQRVYAGADALVLQSAHAAEVEWACPARLQVVGNGIRDLCEPRWEVIQKKRKHRFAQRHSGNPTELRLFFAGHAVKEKGLLDAIRAAGKLAGSVWGQTKQIHFDVAGAFPTPADRTAFDGLVADAASIRNLTIHFHGYLDGEAKVRLFEEADLLVFPTYFHTEAMPLVVIEALSWGLPVIVSTWRELPQLLPSALRRFAVPPQQPEALALEIQKVLCEWDDYDALRDWFVSHYREEVMVHSFMQALSPAPRHES